VSCKADLCGYLRWMTGLSERLAVPEGTRIHNYDPPSVETLGYPLPSRACETWAIASVRAPRPSRPLLARGWASWIGPRLVSAFPGALLVVPSIPPQSRLRSPLLSRNDESCSTPKFRLVPPSRVSGDVRPPSCQRRARRMGHPQFKRAEPREWTSRVSPDYGACIAASRCSSLRSTG
jgi:hypothetical protein